MSSEDFYNFYQQPTARRWVLINVCITAFATPMLSSAALVAIPYISLEFQTGTVLASWIMAAFQLSNMIMLIPGSRIADRYGRKRVYLIGVILYAVSILLIPLVSHIGWVLFCRALQGLGAAMFISTGMALISSIYGGRERGKALGWLASAVYLGLTVGPLLGGWLTEMFGWQAVFYSQLPLVLFSLTLTLVRMPGEWKSEQAIPLDYKGIVMLGSGLLLLYLGVTHLIQWSGLVMLLISGSVFLVFFRHCASTENPLVRFKLVWQNRIFTKSLLAACFNFSGFVGFVFILSLYLQQERRLEPTETGVILMYLALVMAIGTPMVGRVSGKIEPRILATMGSVTIAIGYFSMFIQPIDSPVAWIGAGMMLLGLGFALFSTPNNHSAMNSVDGSRMGIAAALLNLSRLLGQMLGTALAALMFELARSELLCPGESNEVFNAWRGALLLFTLLALFGAYFSRCERKKMGG